MSWDTEIEIYITKLEHIIDGITKILNLQGNRIVSPDMRQTLEALCGKAQILLPKLKANEFEIAVVGLEKAGKSSFSNAFIGLTALPTDDQRCTYTSTCIRAGAESSADVCFYTRQEFDRSFREKLEVLGIPDAASYTIDALSLDKYYQLFEGCSEEKKQLYEDTLNQDIVDTLTNKTNLLNYVGMSPRHFSGPELENEDFKKFIVDPGCAIAVKDIVIRSTDLRDMPNAVMYDVPGFNSPTAMHQEQTLEKMKSADAIIRVAKADEPSITGDVLKIFRKSDTDGELLSDKLFIFANKADRATDLEKNKNVTYCEWIEKRKILPQSATSRIVFGSANAHLGADAPNGMQAREALERLGIKDGIDELREKLQYYYEHDRFAVLKKRIGKILSDVEDLFKPVQLSMDSGNITEPAAVAIALALHDNLKGTLKESLENLKNEVNTDTQQNHPLTTNISNCINDLVVPEKYDATSEELDRYHKEVTGVGNAPQPEKVDHLLREDRFRDMYMDFSTQILSCTGSKHLEVCERVLNIFMDAMRMSGPSEAYDCLRKEVIDFCSMDNSADDDYYQSLTERFARDVFEIQIKYTHGNGRLNKFKEEAPNFFSLGIFYNAFEAKLNGGDELAYIGTTPKASPLWQILLYPERTVQTEGLSETKAAVLKWLQQTAGLISLKMAEELIDRLLPFYGAELLHVVIDEFQTVGFERGRSQPETSSCVKTILLDLMPDKVAIENTDTFLDDVLKTDQSRYLMDVAKKHQNYTYEKVKEEFTTDILALQRVLQYAFVPAVNIDKAFSARETKMIEDIIGKLAGKEFRDFIMRNYRVIESAKMGQFDLEEAQRGMDKAVMEEIRRILDTILNSSAA